MNIVSNQIPIELCNIIQSYQSDLSVSNKKNLFKQVHKDIKVAYDRLHFYQDLLKEKPNRIEWVLIYILIKFYSKMTITTHQVIPMNKKIFKIIIETL